MTLSQDTSHLFAQKIKGSAVRCVQRPRQSQAAAPMSAWAAGVSSGVGTQLGKCHLVKAQEQSEEGKGSVYVRCSLWFSGHCLWLNLTVVNSGDRANSCPFDQTQKDKHLQLPQSLPTEERVKIQRNENSQLPWVPSSGEKENHRDKKGPAHCHAVLMCECPAPHRHRCSP